MNPKLQWFLIGLVTLWILKYMVIGLGEWDRLFHPERLPGDSSGPYKAFVPPLLGIFGK